ncbi:MAG: 16S rRNA (cytidine(1402)-2'-O)-methyltransferase [Cyanobacteria bacterium P01_H01_bin.130]
MGAQREEGEVSGVLYVVATPIGNLEDMTFRAVRILKEVDAIAAEDTRHTGQLLKHFAISTPQISCHQHNESRRIPELIEKLQQGQAIALVSDAGTPGISDPGVPLIAACLDAGIPVVPLPGACAAIAALVASGHDLRRFSFEGFLPVKGRDRRDRLAGLAQDPRTLVLYEAPHRLVATLTDLAESLGEMRQVAIARELTKRYEQIWRGSLGEAIAQWSSPEDHGLTLKGEFVLTLNGAPPILQEAPSDEVLLGELQALLDQGVSKSRASRQLAQTYGLSKRQLYDLSLRL